LRASRVAPVEALRHSWRRRKGISRSARSAP